jgi:molybdopterin-guanine dinucleotide biosynthesis protein A
MSGEPTGNPRAAFILAGGHSSRMGRDKALLPLGGSTLLEHIASQLHAVTKNITIIAPPNRYSHLPYPILPDQIEACGPLGGVLTALSVTTAPWNLIVACDMPALTADFLENLFQAAESSAADAVIPESSTGLDPLCAIYHRRCLAQAALSMDRKILKMHDFVSTLHFRRWPVSNPAPLQNINTPQEWNTR